MSCAQLGELELKTVDDTGTLATPKPRRRKGQVLAFPCHYSPTGVAFASVRGTCTCRPMRLTKVQKVALAMFEPGASLVHMKTRTLHVLEERGLIENFTFFSRHDSRRGAGNQMLAGYRRTVAGDLALSRIRAAERRSTEMRGRPA